MKPLIVLITVFIITEIVIRIIYGHFEHALAGRIAMSAMLLFTTIGHFAFTRGMTMMIPSFIPFKTFFVYLTGLFETIAAVGLVIDSYKQLTAYSLIMFFLIMLPANIYAAIRHIDYQKGNTQGPGLRYLWFRVPLQLLFIVWVYVSAILY